MSASVPQQAEQEIVRLDLELIPRCARLFAKGYQKESIAYILGLDMITLDTLMKQPAWNIILENAKRTPELDEENERLYIKARAQASNLLSMPNHGMDKDQIALLKSLLDHTMAKPSAKVEIKSSHTRNLNVKSVTESIDSECRNDRVAITHVVGRDKSTAIDEAVDSALTP